MSPDVNSSFTCKQVIAPPVVMSFVCLITGYMTNIMVFTTLSRLIALVICMTAATVATTSFRFTRNGFIVFLACAAGWSSILNLSSLVLFYRSFPEHIINAQNGVDLWFFSRLFMSAFFLASCYFLRHSLKTWVINTILGLLVIAGFCAVVSGAFNKYSVSSYTEHLSLLLLAVAMAGYWWNRRLMTNSVLLPIAISLLAFFLSELAFTHSRDIFGIDMIAGHILKLFSFWFLYLALVTTTLTQPFTMLFYAASSFDNIPEPIINVQANGIINQGNEAAAVFAGMEKSSLRGLSNHTLFHCADVSPEACPVCVNLKNTSQPFSADIDRGNNQWIKCTLIPIAPPFPVRAWTQVINDISRCKQIEQARAQAEEQALLSTRQLEQLFLTAQLPMQVISRTTGIIKNINPAFESWSGYSLQDFQSDPENLQRFLGNNASLLEQSWWQNATNGVTDVPLTDPSLCHLQELTVYDKHRHPLIARLSTLFFDQDLFLFWSDLTEIHKKQAELQASERQFRAIIEQDLVGVYVRNKDGFLYTNPAFCNITGWTADELHTKNLVDLTDGSRHSLETIKKNLNEQLKDKQAISYTLPIIRKDGRRIVLRLHGSAILWDDKLAIMAFAQDITEHEQSKIQIAHYVKELERAIKGTFSAVSKMVELRDPYTAGHERRVGLIAKAIGHELGWSKARCDLLELIGMVHDIGKISIPSELLVKPTKLNAIEIELIRGHAQAGYEILKNVHFDAAPVAEIIWQHHERLDGSGYPRGLHAKDILMETRILTVADVLEAMSNHRPYRPAVGLDAALDEIVAQRNIKYDADVVDAAIRLYRTRGKHLPV